MWWVMDPVLFYKSLADETRLKCLLLIQDQQELCVCELMTALDESQPKISRHLALLKQNNVLQSRKHKQWVFYRIADGLPDWAANALSTTAEQNPQFIQTEITLLNGMGDRPIRQQSCCN